MSVIPESLMFTGFLAYVHLMGSGIQVKLNGAPQAINLIQTRLSKDN